MPWKGELMAPEMELDPNEFIRRAEANEAFRALRREMSEVKEGQAQVNAKLDTILSTRSEEARQMGALQMQVQHLQTQLNTTQADLRDMRTKMDEPKTGALKGLWDLVKLLAAALGGAYLSGHGGR